MLTYTYRCHGCSKVEDRDLPLDHRPPRCFQCGCLMHRVYNFAVRIIGRDSGGGKHGSPLGNRHTPERDEFQKSVDAGEAPYGKDDLIW